MKRWALFTFLYLLTVSVFPAQAGVFNVTTAAEFQAALTTAQNNGENDTINVAAGTYDTESLLSPSSFTYAAATEDKSLTIVGAGADSTILQSSTSARRVLTITAAGDAGHSDVHIEGITVRYGQSTTQGGGCYVYLPQSDLSVSRCQFSGNDAEGSGGGAWFLLTSGNAAVRHSVFSWNTAADQGGGVRLLAGGYIAFENNLLYGNSAGSGGGAYVFAAINSGLLRLINNTVSGNTAIGGIDAGGGVRLVGFDSPTVFDVYNNITWGNTPIDFFIDNDTDEDDSPVSVRFFNNVASMGLFRNWDGVIEAGNQANVDPQFVNPGAGDFRLAATSPCIDKGDSAVALLLATDLEGNPRLVDGDGTGVATVDIGAYERPVSLGPFDALIEELQGRSEDLAGSTDKGEQKQKKAVDKVLVTLTATSFSLSADVTIAGKIAKALMKVYSGEFASHGDLFTLFEEIFDRFHGKIQTELDTAQATLDGLPAGSCKDKAQANLDKAALQLAGPGGGDDFAVRFKAISKALKTALKGKKSVASCGG